MSHQPEPLSTKLQRGNLMAAACPSREVLRSMTSQWGVLVLMSLQQGTHRFSELRRRIGGVSERMLSETLKRLERHGLILRVAYPVVPPQTEYSLTPLGVEAARHVAGMADWIEVNLPEILQHRPQQA
ncbi:helix-turn-helix transcriptional regulator [Paracoccus sp. 11-3]|uniref:Helix-turn-helix transcriptional regulator n=1 Tax=Paracoccus amoyensis TaxID=2760093 RepID=A0A926GK77_9RHOB|nr:helix-turn-helix domain-containing protein [Paracoccus amoyensis]MBC9245525.1 helix-turn-helix transcriptional regulator [Paracoccus amoyensis]